MASSSPFTLTRSYSCPTQLVKYDLSGLDRTHPTSRSVTAMELGTHMRQQTFKLESLVPNTAPNYQMLNPGPDEVEFDLSRIEPPKYKPFMIASHSVQTQHPGCTGHDRITPMLILRPDQGYDTRSPICSLNLVCYRSGGEGCVLKQIRVTSRAVCQTDDVYRKCLKYDPSLVTNNRQFFQNMHHLYETDMCGFWRRHLSLKTLTGFRLLAVGLTLSLTCYTSIHPNPFA